MNKWQRFIICFGLIILLLPIATSWTNPEFISNDFSDQNSSTFSQIDSDENIETNTKIKTSTTKTNPLTEVTNEKELVINSEEESDYAKLISKPTDIPPIGTRSDRVDHVEDQDDKPGKGTSFLNKSTLIGSVAGNDLDWFTTTDISANPAPGKVLNITITPSTLSSFASSEDWIHVRLYVFWDFNSNDKVEDKELILLHQESWNPWYTSICWGLTSRIGKYSVCIEGQPKSPSTILSYELDIEWNTVSAGLNDSNYNIENALEITPYTPVKNRLIDMDAHPFDWYTLKTPISSGLLGVNVSVRIKIERSSLRTPYVGGGVAFVMELRAVILHERADGKLIYGHVGNSSLHLKVIDYPPLLKQVKHFDIKFFSPSSSGKIVRSYIGVFIATYGRDSKTHDIKYFDSILTTREEDIALNGWLEYSFVKVNSEPVIQPVLSSVRVYSTKTNTMYGQTPDRLKFHVTYTSRANYPPLIFKVHILRGGNKKPLIKNLRSLQPYTNFMTPTEWVFAIWGSELGEGNYNFQIECWDKHTYAEGSKDDKFIYPGPIIKNNIPPQVRETAVRYLEMKEDDKPVYIKLKDIFADADGDPLTYYLIDQNGNHTAFWQTDSLRLRIMGNSKFRLEPKADKFGKSTVYLGATDQISPYINATHKLVITVAPVNDPPEINNSFSKKFWFAEVRFDEDTKYTKLNLTYDIFRDHPSEFEPLTYKVSGNDNVKVKIFKNGSVILSGKQNWSGAEQLKFTAYDPLGAYVSDYLKVKILPVNDRPILNATPPIIAYEDSWTNITFEAWDPADNDPLIFSTDVAIVVNLKEDEYIFNQKTGKLRLFPPNRVATGKTYSVKVTVRDQPPEGTGKPLTANKIVNITIRNTWDKPICKILEPNNGDKFLHFEPIKFRGICLDDDLLVPEVREKITYQWSSDKDGPLGIYEEINDIILSAGAHGQEHKITLIVSDGKFERNASIRIYVLREDERKDTDNDEMPDYWEDRNYLDKYSSSDADYDNDNDNYTNYEEYYYGLDGLADNNDPTNPWDKNSHPLVELTPKETKKKEVDYFWPIAFIVLIIVVMVALIFIIYMSVTKKVEVAKGYFERKKTLEEQLKKLKEEQERDIKYGVYSPKTADVLCHICGHRNQVNTANRPLAVTCEQCEARGVVY